MGGYRVALRISFLAPSYSGRMNVPGTPALAHWPESRHEIRKHSAVVEGLRFFSNFIVTEKIVPQYRYIK